MVEIRKLTLWLLVNKTLNVTKLNSICLIEGKLDRDGHMDLLKFVSFFTDAFGGIISDSNSEFLFPTHT